MKPRHLVALLSTAALAACTTTHEPSPSHANIVGRTWKLERINGHDSVGHKASLTVSAEGRVGGNTGCNAMFGHANLAAHAIKFEMIGSTKMACTDSDIMLQEHNYVDALHQVAAWRIEGGTLYLTDRARTDVLIFEAD